MAKNPPKKPEMSDADLLAFALKDVDPLPGRKINKEIKNQAPKSNPAIKRSPNAHLRTESVQKISNQPALSHGDSPGLDKRSALRMKRGQMQIEARLDLHGHRQDEAHRALNGFITGAASAGKRCVLVITGKGLKVGNEERQIGILREMVPRWLNEEPNRSRILSFNHATLSDGGTGALYVLLKRKRAGERS
jgi:DNA-nicking Smr family endonuclease